MSSESKSVDEETVKTWKNMSLKGHLEGYLAKDIFNADEIGLFYSVLPNKTMCFRGEHCHGGKLSKNRITILFLTNADGSEKFPLFVIGKSKNPRCFKNIKTLPAVYEANKKSWMTGVFRVSTRRENTGCTGNVRGYFRTRECTGMYRKVVIVYWNFK